jgi:hypothetical protein
MLSGRTILQNGLPKMSSATREEAIRLYEAGEIDQAGAIFAELLRIHPKDLTLWTWLDRCVHTERQHAWCQEQIERISSEILADVISDDSSDGGEDYSDLEFEPITPLIPKTRRRRRNYSIELGSLAVALLVVGVLIAVSVLVRQALHQSPVSAASENSPSNSVAIPAKSAGILNTIRALANPSQQEPIQYLPALYVAEPTPLSTEVEQAIDPKSDSDGRGNPNKWKSWPVVPYVSETARSIYQKGVEKGNDPHAFSVLGDCQSEPDVLFQRFADAKYLDDTAYQSYRKTLRFFSDSWDRYFVTVENGMSVAAAFNATWARNADCKSGETPLACEIRLHKPSILIISLGTNWGTRDPDKFEDYLRQIVDYALEKHVLPVIATKGDPGGVFNPLNERMVKVAYEYDIPLWNFWLSIQDLPYQGLNPWDRGGIYLSTDAWSIKRETGLMTLDAIRRAVQGEN